MVESYSVVIPVYNGADTIGAAVASIMAQSIAPRSIILVDDGSTDDTANVVSSLSGPITLLRQSNAGPGPATTLGMQHVETTLLATLDADDLWVEGKIERQLAALEQAPECAAVFGKLASFTDDPANADYAGARDGWSRSTMLVRTAVALETGPIADTPGRVGEMIDWWARMREGGHVLTMLPEVLALRRIRPGSLTYRNPSLGGAYLKIARAALERRRQAAAEKDEG